MMTAEDYRRITQPLRDRPRLLRGLLLFNRLLVYVCYALYPLLLVLVLLTRGADLWRFVLMPAGSFGLLTAVRARIDAPRPYEVLVIDPLIHKSTQGRSFPSRHVFSIFVIAMAWLAYLVPVGAILLVLGAGMAVFRVVAGVHWPRDVVVGALCGTAAGLLMMIKI